MRRIAYGLMGGAAVVLLTAAAAMAVEDDPPTPRARPDAETARAQRMAEAISIHGELKDPPRRFQTALVDEDGDPPFTILPPIYVLVATAGICVLGFKNSKRTHLD